MKDYQQKRLGNYVLPQPVYRQALWAVKDLDRLKASLSALKADAYVLPGHDMSIPVFGFGSGLVCDSTGSKAVKIASLSRRIEAIEDAFALIPAKYRKGIMAKLVLDEPYDEEAAHLNTWKKWQQILLYHVAVNLQLF